MKVKTMNDISVDATNHDRQLLDLSSKIVSAYVSHNSLSPSDLPKLITEVHNCLQALLFNKELVLLEEPKPAVPVRKSVTADFIICLEDGKNFKSLKRHLRTHFNLSPDDYREKWGLPANYPMVAPNYSATRSKLAKNIGLGRKVD